MQICRKEECCGCFACMNACPKQCIQMVADNNENGHVYPQIDITKCINCGLCKKVCERKNELELRTPSTVYAGWNKDAVEQAKSSSGGMASLLSAEIIRRGGYVFGAAFSSDWSVEHVCINKENDIDKLRKSKYVHSHINDIYAQVKLHLTEEKPCLFIGTPCQVAGLKAYLNKEYPNLFTIDLICHGVPSEQIYKEYIEKAADMNNLESLAFRGKSGFGFYFGYSDKNEVFTLRQSYYMRGFMDGLFYRESCYDCKFAQPQRVGDITLGDFWGIGKEVPFENPENRGVSLVMVNTSQGTELFNSIKGTICFQERELSEAINGNAQLRAPSIRPKNYKKFKKIYSKKGFWVASKKSYFKMRTRLFLEKYKIIKKTY